MSAVGCYLDILSERGVVQWQSGGWRHNLIVASAWPLLAALLKNDPGVRGVLFCAFGEGDPIWDRAPPCLTPDTVWLRKEMGRTPVGSTDVKYIDGTGRSVPAATNRLEFSVTYRAPGVARDIREFGLVGGDASTAANSGRMVNYAVHPVIRLAANQTLTRKIRLSFRPGGSGTGEHSADVPLHWLASQPVTVIDGVGEAVATSLRNAGATDVGQLVSLELEQSPKGVSRTRVVELKAKARLAMQTAAHLVRISSVSGKTVDELLATAPDLATPAHLLEMLQGQLGLLLVALDARWLRRRTLADLTSSHAP